MADIYYKRTRQNRFEASCPEYGLTAGGFIDLDLAGRGIRALISLVAKADAMRCLVDHATEQPTDPVDQ